MKHSVEDSDNEVVVTVEPGRWPLEAVRMAAHVMADRAYAHLSEDEDGVVVSLHAKETLDARGLEALGALFDREVQNQTLRLKLESANRETMQYIVSRALVPAIASSGAAAELEAELSADQKSEIERLIAEAEAEIAELKKDEGGTDPLGITKTWQENNPKGGA